MNDLNRRKFIGNSTTGASLLGAGLISSSSTSAQSVRCQTGEPKKRVVMKLGCQSPPSTDEHFAFLARYGIQHVNGYPTRADRTLLYPTIDELKTLVALGARHGISIDMTETVSLQSGGHTSAVMLGKSPERDKEIEAFQTTIRNCAIAGIPILKYNLTLLPVLRSAKVPGRGDAVYRQWKLADEQDAPITAAGRVSTDESWERIDYFLSRVVPVAEEYKIRIALHPEDPGTPPGYRGVDRVLGTVDGLQRFVAMHESAYHGLNFCQGTVSENLEDPAMQIYDVIRYFGERKKIFNVHFRNIRGRRNDFVAEIFPDEGSVDFVRAIRVYRDVGYDGMLMPDHVPLGSPEAELQNFAYAYGYIRGLMQSADETISGRADSFKTDL
jgi:mannonate dehydratase